MIDQRVQRRDHHSQGIAVTMLARFRYDAMVTERYLARGSFPVSRLRRHTRLVHPQQALPNAVIPQNPIQSPQSLPAPELGHHHGSLTSRFPCPSLLLLRRSNCYLMRPPGLMLNTSSDSISSRACCCLSSLAAAPPLQIGRWARRMA